jgi:hypothetical protein
MPQSQKALQAARDAFDARKDRLKNALADLVLNAYTYHEYRMDNVASMDSWNLTDQRRHIIIYVDSETFDGQTDWKIKLRVQSAADPTVSLFNRPTRELTKNDFSPLTIEGGQRVYWAQREMTGEYVVNSSIQKELKDHRDALNAILQKTDAGLKAADANKASPR